MKVKQLIEILSNPLFYDYDILVNSKLMIQVEVSINHNELRFNDETHAISIKDNQYPAVAGMTHGSHE